MRNRVFWRETVGASAVRSLANLGRVPPWSAEFLIRRGIESREALNELDAARPMSDPLNLPQMEQACWVIRHHLKAGRRVRVYGDYDADGVTATAVLVRGLRLMGYADQVDYYIPNRFDEGYGLNPEAVFRAHQDRVGLMVTVDCGSSSPEAADLARSLGLPLVVTDHHALPERLPDVDALVNPECQTPVDRLSGAGVALQLVRALLGEEPPDLLYGIAAVGTVADVVPLTGNNRRLVARGLSAIQAGRVPGVSALFALDRRAVERASAEDLGFLVGPRLNAAGRMGDADAAVRLLVEDDPKRIEEAAVTLTELNQERRLSEARIIDEAWQRLPRDSRGRLYPFTVIAGDGWNQGVVGIVASRFREWLRRPVAVVAWEGDQGKGSARSVDGFNLIRHLRDSAHLFSKLGGHPGAAGFSLPRTDESHLCEVLSEHLPTSVMAQQYQGYQFDMAYEAGPDGRDLYGQVEQFQPYGHGFQTPRMLVRGTVLEARTMGQENQHLRLSLQSHDIRAVGFGLGQHQPALQPGTPVRFLATLETNWFRDQASPQWRMQVLDAPWPRRALPVRRGRPEHLSGRIVFIVDSDRAVRKAAEDLHAAPYFTALSMGELIGMEEQARRGLIQQVVVSQWRPWPRLFDWADFVIWLCPPRNRVKWEQSGSLVRQGGEAWLDAAGPVDGVAQKARRVSLSRERLGRHWRQWQTGRVGMVPGRAVFEELELHPEHMEPGERRPLEQSHLYRMASMERVQDGEFPFDGTIFGEEEMHGLD